jgi:hypothetical protein
LFDFFEPPDPPAACWRAEEEQQNKKTKENSDLIGGCGAVEKGEVASSLRSSQ